METAIKTISLEFVNCYLVDTGSGFILVDTGFPFKRADLEKELSSAGCVPGNLKLVIITHGDIDHTGNCAFLREKYGVKIAMHKDDSMMVETGEMLPDRKVKSRLLKMMQVFMKSGFKKMMAGFEKFKPDIYLDEGQNLSEYGTDAIALHIPGHTDGSIGILFSGGEFISGDILENFGRPHVTPIIGRGTELAASCERLTHLGIKTVYPGHGRPFLMEDFLKNKKRLKKRETKTIKNIFVSYADYNRSANRDLMRVLGKMPEEKLLAPTGAYYESVYSALLHIFFSNDTFFLKLYKNLNPGDHFLDNCRFFPMDEACYKKIMEEMQDPKNYYRYRREMDEIIVKFIEKLGKGKFKRPFESYNSAGEPVSQELWKTLLVLFNHQTHHRGQVSAFLDQFGVENDYSSSAWEQAGL